MDERAGGPARGAYREPRIEDYGTLAQLTADGAPLLMRQLGVGGGAALLATAPAAPGGGGGAVGGIVAVGTPAAPESALGGEVIAPGGGEGGEGTAPGESGAQGATGRVGAGQVAGPSELPFTGLDVAATAALGAATTAAGVALRKALPEDPG